jgi:hypothetical protein
MKNIKRILDRAGIIMKGKQKAAAANEGNLESKEREKVVARASVVQTFFYALVE